MALRRFLRHAEQSGALYGGAAAASAGAAGAFYFLDQRERQQRNQLADELDNRAASKRGAYAAKPTEDDAVPTDAQALWRGTIVSSSPGLMGDVMLRGSKVGDMVEVIAEDTGPGGSYLKCRNPTTGATGLYPMQWVRHPERGLPEEQRAAC